jgi:two-component system, OmpR family, sensor histidine kinase MprB
MRLRLAARSPRDWSVRTRLGAASTIAATVGLTVAGATAYLVTSQVLHQQLDDSLRGAPAGNQGPPSSTVATTRMCEALRSSSQASPALFTLELISSDGTVCRDPSTSAVVLTHGDRSSSGRVGDIRLRDGELKDGTHVRVAVTPAGNGGTIVIARDASSVDSVLLILKLTLAGVVLLGAVTALALSRRVAGVALSPVTKFARIAEEVAATGNLEKHVIARGPVIAGQPGDELDRLSHAFNTMTSVLADAWARQRRLVADAGHELRTPLSSIRSNVELLQRSRRLGRSLPSGVEEQLLLDLDGQITEMSQLVDDLVDLSSAESNDPEHELFRLDHCVEQALARARRRTTNQDLAVRLEPWIVNGDEPAVERAVVNLLDNAIKFSPQHSRIDIDLHDGVLTVADRGTGIATDDAPRAFERFWRSPEARSLPGSGLGLSIVHEVAVQHGGEARLDSRPGGGAIACLSLPGEAPAPSDDA